MSAGPRRLKDPILERYLAGAMEPSAQRDLERVLSESAPDRARAAELRADSQAFLTLHPPGQMVARFEKENAPRRFWQLPAFMAPLGAAVALAAVLLVARPPEAPYSAKGRVALTLHRRVGASSVKVEKEQALKPGDAIRFEVRAPAPGYVAVVSRDASGQVTVYYPFGKQAAAPYDPRIPLLPSAIELDEVLGRETIYAFYAKGPFDLGGVLSALAAGKDPAQAAPGLEVAQVPLLKQ